MNDHDKAEVIAKLTIGFVIQNCPEYISNPKGFFEKLETDDDLKEKFEKYLKKMGKKLSEKQPEKEEEKGYFEF